MMTIVASVALIASFRSNKIAKNTLNEITRPHVVIELVFKNEFAFFAFTNHGSRLANNISIEFDDNFVNSITFPQAKEAFIRLSRAKFNLAPHQTRKIHFTKFGDDIIGRYQDVEIKYSYDWNKSCGKTEEEKEVKLNINLSDYTWISEVNGE